MCNIFGGRLFLVPNPCCCCDLRCGVAWTGFCDIIIGLLSVAFLTTLNVENIERLAIQEQHGSLTPIFDLTKTLPYFGKEVKLLRFCYELQVVSGFMIICASYGMGSHNFSRFLLSCTWLLARFLIILLLFTRAHYLLRSSEGTFKRYGRFVALHILLDVYLFIVVRYYSMECFDAYRYQKIVNSKGIRREPPLTSKSAPKTRPKKPSKKRRETRVDSERKLSDIGDSLQKRRDSEVDINAYAERIPVWDRKNEVIFYGEDYTNWDPTIFLARWELLNETEKEEKPKVERKKVRNMPVKHDISFTENNEDGQSQYATSDTSQAVATTTAATTNVINPNVSRNKSHELSKAKKVTGAKKRSANRPRPNSKKPLKKKRATK